MAISPTAQLTKIISKPTWKDVLIRMIHEKRLDPWDIDLSILTREFIRKMQEMREMGLTIGGNMVLASSILLKYKSEVLVLKEEVLEPPLAPSPTFVQPVRLSLPARFPPKKPITLHELIEEMERIIERRSRRRTVEVKPPILSLPEPKFDVEREISFVLNTLEKKKKCTLMDLVQLSEGADKKEQIVRMLFACLLLAKEGKVRILQEHLFGDVYVFSS